MNKAMKDALPEDFAMVQCRQTTGLQVIDHKSNRFVGGCNVCLNHDDYPVKEVLMRGLSIRLCARCSKSLSEMLK